ncbi:hypothetical protein ABW20_dc0105337 [Dactylellina cionopaga]|nr:hypothetical protein ABW20_dc0105337 [Dactylellina cionopaga]
MESQITILDGAIGTLLCDTISPEASISPLWASVDLLRNPQRLSNLHRQYLAAGAKCISTATYQLSRNTLRYAGVEDEGSVKDICAAGMTVALDARRHQEMTEEMPSTAKSSVALSLGPFGACLQPSQEYSGVYPAPYEKDGSTAVESLRIWHADRLGMFKEASAVGFNDIDILAFETVPWNRLDEIEAIRKILDSEEYRLQKAWISMVYPETVEEDVVKEIVQEVFKNAPIGSAQRGIGINCTKLSLVKDIVEFYSKAVKEMGLAQQDVFLVIYPDGGLTYDSNTKSWSGHDGMASIKAWCDILMEIARGAKEESCWGDILVGGCCKTTPAHILQLADTINDLI